VAHRLAFGVSTLLMLLLFRHGFTGHGVLLAGNGRHREIGRGGRRRAGRRRGGHAVAGAPVGRSGAIRIALVVAGLTSLVLSMHIRMRRR